jgi:hypothetical protein
LLNGGVFEAAGGGAAAGGTKLTKTTKGQSVKKMNKKTT